MVNSDTNPATNITTSLSDFISDFPQSKDPKICKLAEDVADRLLDEECESKEFIIDSGRPCPKTGEAAKVDLVVVIDTSDSMENEAEGLSSAAEDAIQVAQESCPSNLRVVWLGIEGTFNSTKFDQTVREYLKANGVNGSGPPGDAVQDSDLVGRVIGTVPGQGAQEDGARAIQDISDHFDWTPGAARLIFYLGDESLEGGGDVQTPADTIAANMAIAAANGASVIVHTYAGDRISVPSDTADDYKLVADMTGGTFFSFAAGDINNFADVLEEVICSGTQVCKPADIPELAPCFKIHWGDGPKDMIETTDTECLCITACNRYSNVTFKDLTVVISVVTKEDGTPVPNLPDGTPSVYIKPSKFICFGDLPPCDPHKPDELSCLSRELVLVSCGAMEGDYCFKILYCYSVHFDLKGVDKFKLPLCAS